MSEQVKTLRVLLFCVTVLSATAVTPANAETLRYEAQRHLPNQGRAFSERDAADINPYLQKRLQAKVAVDTFDIQNSGSSLALADPLDLPPLKLTIPNIAEVEQSETPSKISQIVYSDTAKTKESQQSLESSLYAEIEKSFSKESNKTVTKSKPSAAANTLKATSSGKDSVTYTSGKNNTESTSPLDIALAMLPSWPASPRAMEMLHPHIEAAKNPHYDKNKKVELAKLENKVETKKESMPVDGVSLHAAISEILSKSPPEKTIAENEISETVQLAQTSTQEMLTDSSATHIASVEPTNIENEKKANVLDRFFSSLITPEKTNFDYARAIEVASINTQTPMTEATIKEGEVEETTINSQGAIIKKRVLHMAETQPEIEQAKQFAALMPAAGNNESPAVQPLIPLPSTSQAVIPASSTPEIATSVQPANIGKSPTNVSLPSDPLLALQDVPVSPAKVDAVPASLAATGEPPKQIEKSRALAEVKEEEKAAIEPETKKEPAASEAKVTDGTNKTVTDKKPIKSAPKAQSKPKPKEAKMAEAPQVTDAENAPSEPIAEIDPAMMPMTEPMANLTKESKKIAKSIAANVDSTKNKAGHVVDIDRAKDMKDLFGGDTKIETTRHEALGIKIEVKNPKRNMDYEMEKAYHASLSGQSDAAIETYKQVLQNNPNHKAALFGLATLYHRAGQIDAARPLYGRLLALDPDNREAINNFMVLLADEAPEEALSQLDALEKRSPEFSAIPAQKAVIYQKLGDAGRATENMLRAVTLSPENLTYRYNLAVMLDKQGKGDEASLLYKQLLLAYQRGEKIPGDAQKIQERVVFISTAQHN